MGDDHEGKKSRIRPAKDWKEGRDKHQGNDRRNETKKNYDQRRRSESNDEGSHPGRNSGSDSLRSDSLRSNRSGAGNMNSSNSYNQQNTAGSLRSSFNSNNQITNFQANNSIQEQQQQKMFLQQQQMQRMNQQTNTQMFQMQQQMSAMGAMGGFQLNPFNMFNPQALPQQQNQMLAVNRKVKQEFLEFPPSNQQEFRSILLDYFSSELFDYPLHAAELFENILEAFSDTKDAAMFLRRLELTPLLQELSDKKAIKLEPCAVGTKLFDFILDINRDKIKQLSREFSKDRPKCMPVLDKKADIAKISAVSTAIAQPPKQIISKKKIEDLLKKETGLQKEVINQSKEKSNLLNKISAAEEQALASFRKQGTRRIDYCDCGTRDKCMQILNSTVPCSRAHFRKLIRPHTDENLGNCSYLDTCRHMDYCKFVHYELDVDMHNINNDNQLDTAEKKLNPQWINCDLRQIDFNILGKFNVIMADPPWDIHMTLPYGTLKDREMKAMRVDLLQDEGCIFVWVTGRAMELGRECLANWGYNRVEEIIWVKTNQLQRIIRTGRTGHWLNHSKEHCLVGIKGNPKINKKIDCDVIVSEVRETSRKPDEIYNLIERMSPGGKKIELFGRPHNTMPGWLTLGNQLPGIYLEDEEIIDRYRDAYPDQEVTAEMMEKNRIRMKNENDIENIYNSHIQPIPPFKTKQLSKELISQPTNLLSSGQKQQVNNNNIQLEI